MSTTFVLNTTNLFELQMQVYYNCVWGVNMETFGKRLKYLRSLKNKQQKEVAIDLNLSKTGYSAYENDLRMPGVKTLIKIADYYNVSIDFLLGRDVKSNIDKAELAKIVKQLQDNINSLSDYIDSCK